MRRQIYLCTYQDSLIDSSSKRKFIVYLVNYVGSDTLCLVRQFRQNGKYIDICFCFVLLPPNFPKLSVNPHSIRLPGGALTTSDTPLGSLLAWSDTIAENDNIIGSRQDIFIHYIDSSVSFVKLMYYKANTPFLLPHSK